MTKDREDRLLLGSGIVLAANAGGAWSPIGDITTTMLWIGGQLSSFAMIGGIFLPSFVCCLIALWLMQRHVSGTFDESDAEEWHEATFLSNFIFTAGISALIIVPIFKIATGLPPFMGILLGLSILWLITDIMHKYFGHREELTVPHVISRLDFSGAIFFLGILLTVDAMETAGILARFATYLYETVGNMGLIAAGIGLVSAVIDNVPLVAAAMGMFSLKEFPQDHYFWQLLAYCAGVGGSIFVFGSAPGVAFMGVEKVDFMWYVRKASLPALISYLAGLLFYWVVNGMNLY